MKRLLINNKNDDEAKLFNNKARIFNSKLSFASISFNDVNQNLQGIPAMRIQGLIYHNIGTIHPIDHNSPQFLQCFFYEHNNNDHLFTPAEWIIMQNILQEIRQYNSFFRSVKSHVEQTEAGLNSELPNYRLIISDEEPINAPTRTYNAPTCVEVAAIVLGINPTEENHSVRYVTINSRVEGNNFIRRIPETHSSYDPLSYVCTHIHGDVGWNLNMKESPTSNKKLSPMDYYSYRAQVRDEMT